MTIRPRSSSRPPARPACPRVPCSRFQRCTHPAAATQQRLGGPGRWLLALPAHHIAGLQVLLRCAAAGVAPDVLDTAVPFTPARFVDAVAAMAAPTAEFQRRYVSLVPTQLHRILAEPEAAEAARTFDAVLVGGAAAAPTLLDRATTAGITVVTSYGMSETCGGCVYDGHALDGMSVSTDGDGRIALSGRVVARGYRGRPGDPAFPTPGTFRTDDWGTVTAGRLTVLGRRDDLIMTGGVKIAPSVVEARLATMPGVAQALVVGVPDPHWGEAVTALITVNGPAPDVEATAGRRGRPVRGSPAQASGRGGRTAADRSWQAGPGCRQTDRRGCAAERGPGVTPAERPPRRRLGSSPVARADQWVAAARPRTLPAAISPVLVGSGLAAAVSAFSWWKGLLTLLVSVALQVGVNYANDYSDGIRGTDTDRVGPFRLVGSGAARPATVKAAAFGCFALAGAAGLVLAVVTAWWLILIGAACILAAWFYTGGPRPYGYAGLGEVFVFVFFGLVAVLGTEYVMAERITLTGIALAIGIGLLGLRRAGGQQPAGRRDRRCRRQAHAGRAAGRRR